MENRPIPEISSPALEGLLDVIDNGIWDWNGETGQVYRNKAWFKMLGYDPHCFEDTVLTWENLIHPDDFQHVMEHFDAYIHQRSEEYKVQYRCKMHNGKYLWIEDNAKIVKRRADGTVSRMIGAHRNIHSQVLLIEEYKRKNQSLEELIARRTQELTELNEKLQKQIAETQVLAMTDALTETANRFHFEQTLNQEIERAKRFNEPLSMIEVDIDHFKNINDQYGHAVGDQVLITITQTIREQIREIDTISRWGGDEIMILLPHTNLEEAKHVAEKTRSIIEALTLENNIHVTSSFGVAELKPNESLKDFMIRTDQALYQSKEAGRNTVNAV
ncbi:MAG: diguanylate cyclase [Gammaproteobacteria bacterium]|nr:diguanylate cyclase [Gammaproteobacteria bacterium]